jgi:hypothetical protein
MTKYLYSPGEIQAEIRKSEQEAAVRPAKRVNEAAGDLEVTRSIPRKLFMNAVVGHGVDPNDHEYWKDQERVCPSIKVKNVSTKLFFGPLARFEGPLPRRNRFGVVTFTKRYG